MPQSLGVSTTDLLAGVQGIMDGVRAAMGKVEEIWKALQPYWEICRRYLGEIRPWGEFVQLSTPEGDVERRLEVNLTYYQINYAALFLLQMVFDIVTKCQCRVAIYVLVLVRLALSKKNDGPNWEVSVGGLQRCKTHGWTVLCVIAGFFSLCVVGQVFFERAIVWTVLIVLHGILHHVDPEMALTVYPATDDIDVAVCRKGDAPGAAPVMVGRASSPIDVSQLGDAEYKVTISILTNKAAGKASSTTFLRTFDIAVTAGCPHPWFLDSGATITKFGVFVRDEPVQNATIILRHLETKVLYAAETDGTGYTCQALPPGWFLKQILHKDVAAEEEKFNVPSRLEKTEPPLAPEPPMTNNRFHDCKEIIRDRFYAGQNVAVLGDVSGSMGAPGQMPILRKTLRFVHEEATKANAKVHLYTWNTDVVETYAGEAGVELDRWLAGLKAVGGNDMHQSLLRVLQQLPRVQDVYVMCDGDVSPFEESQDWPAFARAYGHIRFHFVALGSGSDHESMQEMALQGKGGTFTHAT